MGIKISYSTVPVEDISCHCLAAGEAISAGGINFEIFKFSMIFSTGPRRYYGTNKASWEFDRRQCEHVSSAK